MSWELALWLLALCAPLLLVVQLVRFLRADGDLTLLWAEWQGRRPGEDPAWGATPGSPWALPLGQCTSGRRGCLRLPPARGGRRSVQRQANLHHLCSGLAGS